MWNVAPRSDWCIRQYSHRSPGGHAGGLIVAGLMLLAGFNGGNVRAVATCGFGLLLVTQLMIAVFSGKLPERIWVGNLVTFRDLAYALAGQEPRRRIQPTP